MDAFEALIRLILIGAMLLLLVGGLLAILALWYMRGRDPGTGLIADIISEPPDDLPPGAVGTLLDEHVDHRDVVATLLGLGRHGAVSIEAEKTPNSSARDYTITLLHPEKVENRIERDLLRVLFGNDPQPLMEMRLNQVRKRFVDAEPQIRNDLYGELVSRGYVPESPHATRKRWQLISWMGLILSVIVGVIVSVTIDPVAIATTNAAVIVWAVMIRVSRHMGRKTPAGAEAAARWRAFKRYLESISIQRDLTEASDIFDRYLSYAVAFGIDKQWIRAFSESGARKPGWFDDADAGDVIIVGDIGHIGDVGDFSGAGDLITSIGGAAGNLSMPDVDISGESIQGVADTFGGSLQGASDGLSGLLDSAGSIFDAIDFDL